MAAPLITTAGPPATTRYCGYHHGPVTDCPVPSCPTGGLIRVWSGEEWEYVACTCPVCVEAVAA